MGLADTIRVVWIWFKDLHWEEHLDYGDGQVHPASFALFRLGVGIGESRMDHLDVLVCKAVRPQCEVQATKKDDGMKSTNIASI